MLLIGNLFLSGLRYTARTERRALATLVAERQLASLRAWAATPTVTGYNFDNWSGVNSTPQADPLQSNYRAQVQAVPRAQMFSASSSLEADHTLDQRAMPGSAEQVCISVWEVGDPGQVYRLWSLIGDPGRTLNATNPLVITPTAPLSGSVPRDGTVDFTAQAFDTLGRPIADLFFAWYVIAIDGNGSIKKQSRDGKKATFINQIVIQPPGIPAPPATTLHAPGRVNVQLRAVYRGVEITQTYPLVLAP
jgi:hypothetical protein